MNIQKVARRAGVSTATVSRVINSSPGVNSQTAARVRAAMKELKYTPSPSRPGPKPGSRQKQRASTKKRSIVLLTVGQTSSEWLALPLMASVFGGITAAAAERGLRLLVDEMPDPQRASSIISDRHADGAIVFWSARVRGDPSSLLHHNLPLVHLLGATEGLDQVDHVTTDHSAVGKLAHRYLASCGRHELAFVSEFPSWPLMRMRGQAFADAGLDHGDHVCKFLLSSDRAMAETYRAKSFTAATLEELMDKLCSQAPKITGIFSSTDRLTLKLYPMLQSRKLIPGRDLTVVSCDNQEPLLSLLDPRPASVDLRPEIIGRLAVSRLLHRLEHPQETALQLRVPPVMGLPVSGENSTSADAISSAST